MVSREKCACPKTNLCIPRITDRNDDMIEVRGVNFYPKQIESFFLKEPGAGNDYLIGIDRVAGADQLRIRVEAKDPGDSGFTENWAGFSMISSPSGPSGNWSPSGASRDLGGKR